MFFVHEMEERIPLHPSYFSSEAPDSIRELLYKKKEGTNTGTMMIVRIIGILEISEPKVMPGTGMAMYTISYRAVVWQPFRGEVVDGEVSQVVTNGFFVDVGALSVFVSKAMIPAQLKFSMEGATPSFADNEGQTVEAGSQVRLRIKGIRSELNQMFAIGSIREDYLGSEFRTTTASIVFLKLSIGRAVLCFVFVTAVYHYLDFSEALEKLVKVEKNKCEGKETLHVAL